MEKVTNVNVHFEPSDQIKKQGKRSDIERYLNSGYIIQENRNGFWVLVKALKLLVTLTSAYGFHTFSMKEEVLNYYNRQRISPQLIETFKKDIASEKITFEMDKDCSSYVMN